MWPARSSLMECPNLSRISIAKSQVIEKNDLHKPLKYFYPNFIFPLQYTFLSINYDYDPERGISSWERTECTAKVSIVLLTIGIPTTSGTREGHCSEISRQSSDCVCSWNHTIALSLCLCLLTLFI